MENIKREIKSGKYGFVVEENGCITQEFDRDKMIDYVVDTLKECAENLTTIN